MAVEKARKNRKNKLKIIKFDSEIITKDDATQIVKEQKDSKINRIKPESFQTKNESKFLKNAEDALQTVQNKLKRKSSIQPNIANPVKSKKKKKLGETATQEADLQLDEEVNDLNVEKTNTQKKESIREKKRKKHAKLLADKKLKAELSMQQKSLNYLSRWKHNREDWKFEKLRQIWLQQSLFDTSKIPNEFWDSAVEYFRGAKGQTRKILLDEALKIIDVEGTSEEHTEETNDDDEDYQIKLQRARAIVQHLQE